MVEYGRNKKLPTGDPAVEFGGIVGQSGLKEALLAVVAHEGLDGLLVVGEKGTAKSTAVRATADLLPRQRAVADCPYGCPPDDASRQCSDCRARTDPDVEERPTPVVTLPLGATRDRVVGSLSVDGALNGEPSFEPGLLARANRGILYVDEVNLLDDHLVDLLLDAAAGGTNRVERDGVSVIHPAEFTLVGTMNPEEGALRPQLRDRFALRASVSGCEALERRVEIIDGALGERPSEEAAAETERAARRLGRARRTLADVELPHERRLAIAETCRDAGVDGHRGDVAAARAAVALAALDGRTTVSEADVRRALELALPHRLRTDPFEDGPSLEDVLDDPPDEGGEGDGVDGDESGGTDGGASDGDEPDGSDVDRSEGADGANGAEPDGSDERDGRDAADRGRDGADSDGERSAPGGDADGSDGSPNGDRRDGAGGAEASGGGGDPDDRGDGAANGGGDGGRADSTDGADAAPLVPGQSRPPAAERAGDGLAVPDDAVTGREGGRRAATEPGPDRDGPRVRTESAESNSSELDAAASVRAAAARGADGVASRDLRRSVRVDDGAALVLFVVDASASMRGPLRTAKGVALDLLRDAYEARDRVGLVTFAGDDAEVVLPPTDSPSHAARHLKELPSGDRTPLPAGLRAAAEVLDRAEPAASVVVLVTDGRANASDRPASATRRAATRLGKLADRTLVVDAGEENDRAGLVAEIVSAADGDRLPLAELTAARVDDNADKVYRSR